MKLKLNIKDNAIDSLNESLAKYEQALNGDLKALKFSITHLAHCVELTLKVYLQTLDKNLVFKNCFRELRRRSAEAGIDLLSSFNILKKDEGFDFGELIKGEQFPHTVTIDQALSVIELETCSITKSRFIDQSFIDDINWMKSLRNSIAHFEVEFSIKEARLCIGRLVRGLYTLTECFSLFDLEDEIGANQAHIFKLLADEYESALMEAHISVAEESYLAFSGIRPKHRMFVEWNVYTCPECGNETMIPNKQSSTGYRCTFEYCSNEESDDIEVDCDACGAPWPNGQMTRLDDYCSMICPRCVNPEAW